MEIKNIEEFKKVGEFFLSLPTGAKVDMTVCYSDVEVDSCRTPANFGIWLGVFYDTEKDKCGYRYDSDGAYAFAKALGLKNYFELEAWARMNPKIWGNVWGGQMFRHCIAFNEGDKGCAVRTIGEKWMSVYERLVNEKKESGRLVWQN